LFNGNTGWWLVKKALYVARAQPECDCARKL